MLYWPTERGAPNVVEDIAPHPTEQQPFDELLEEACDEWLDRVMEDAAQSYTDNAVRLRMRYLQQLEDFQNLYRLRVEATWRTNQEAQDESTPIQ